MPFKRGAREAPIEYLERGEMDALLSSIDRSTRLGRRDYALFALMFNTGARVQEVLDLRVATCGWTHRRKSGCWARATRHALCPLWPATARLLRGIMARSHRLCRRSRQLAAVHQRAGRPLTRYGVRYLLRRYLKKAARAGADAA